MTAYSAVAVAEGFDGEEPDTDKQLAAWQYIKDHNLHLHLQGFFGRTVHALVNQGVLE
jgi:hypothetical protein